MFENVNGARLAVKRVKTQAGVKASEAKRIVAHASGCLDWHHLENVVGGPAAPRTPSQDEITARLAAIAPGLDVELLIGSIRPTIVKAQTGNPRPDLDPIVSAARARAMEAANDGWHRRRNIDAYIEALNQEAAALDATSWSDLLGRAGLPARNRDAPYLVVDATAQNSRWNGWFLRIPLPKGDYVDAVRAVVGQSNRLESGIEAEVADKDGDSMLVAFGKWGTWQDWLMRRAVDRSMIRIVPGPATGVLTPAAMQALAAIAEDGPAKLKAWWARLRDYGHAMDQADAILTGNDDVDGGFAAAADHRRSVQRSWSSVAETTHGLEASDVSALRNYLAQIATRRSAYDIDAAIAVYTDKGGKA